MMVGTGTSFPYFSPGPRNNSSQFTSTRGWNPFWIFGISWHWGKANSKSPVSSDERSYCKWAPSKSKVLWHVYVISSSSLLPLLYLQQLCGTLWSSLPMGGPMYWTGKLLMYKSMSICPSILNVLHGFLDFGRTWSLLALFWFLSIN